MQKDDNLVYNTEPRAKMNDGRLNINRLAKEIRSECTVVYERRFWAKPAVYDGRISEAGLF